jgi:Legume lectin domain
MSSNAPQVYLSWEASSSVVVGYRVYRGTISGGPYLTYSTALIPVLSYTDTAVAAGTTYYYVVTAIDAAGVESPHSNEVAAVIPSPSGSPSIPIGLIEGLNLNGSAALNGSSLSLTTTGNNLAGSAWYPTPVNIQAFSTDFNFQITDPTSNCMGDGFAFVVQNQGQAALGPSGGGLGYGPDNITNPSSSSNTPIGKSVAIKFDLFNNAGEGTNSTGLYMNGASPTDPAITLGNGVSLQSGDPFLVHLAYDGTILKMTITDTMNSADTYVASTLVNIPSVVGGNTAYVGFTGGTGGCVSNQNILSWNYSPSETPDFSGSILPTSQSISLSAGEGAVYSVSILPVGGLNLNVALSVMGVPTGATATFSPSATITGSSGNSTLTITPTGAISLGTYTLGITGTGGSVTHTGTVSLTINP